MSSFSFIHAADLHLGSPFQSLAVKDASIAARFALATRKAFTNLVDTAIERAVDFLIIAGDVYDGEWKDNSVGLFFNREVARLAQAGIPVVFLRGNHDAESVVTKSVPLPESVRQFSTRKPETIRFEDLGVALHGQGFAERVAQENLAVTYPAPDAGAFNIGVLHTSLDGREKHATYAPCSVSDLVNRGYDYWALGHVHEFELAHENPHIVFPGNLQGRSIRETGAKGAVLVSVADGRITEMERLTLDEARWARLTLDIGDHEDLGSIPRSVAHVFEPIADEAGERLVAIRIELTGPCAFRRQLMAARSELADDIQAACHHVHPDAWLEKLAIDVSEPETRSNVPAIDPSIDIEGMLADLLKEPEQRDEAQTIVTAIASKLPGGIGSGDNRLGDPEMLLAEARDLLIARAEADR